MISEQDDRMRTVNSCVNIKSKFIYSKIGSLPQASSHIAIPRFIEDRALELAQCEDEWWLAACLLFVINTLDSPSNLSANLEQLVLLRSVDCD